MVSVSLAGCVGGERTEPPAVPPVASIPVAPVVSLDSDAPDVTREPGPLPVLPAPDAIAGAPPTVAVAPPAAEEASSGPAEPEPADASALVSVVDEAPFYSHAEATASAAPDRRHARRRAHHHRPYHPAPGIIVDVVDARGGSAAAMQRVARNAGYWPFRRCYEEGLRRNQSLVGKVPLDVVVGSGGAVESVTVTAPTLGDPSVVTCVAREALHLALVADESPAEAKMVITLALGDEPVPVARSVPGAEEIRAALRKSWPAVEQCYAAGLSKHPGAGGRMEVRFRVDARGEVAEVTEGVAGLGDADLTRCIVGVYGSAHLPPIRGGLRDATFFYAMHLEPRSNVLPAR